jgi:hypothetical protein
MALADKPRACADTTQHWKLPFTVRHSTNSMPYRMYNTMQPNFSDISGMIFSRWTVLRRGERTKHGTWDWICRCECGTERSVNGQSLRTGRSKSCGCFHKEVMLKANVTHGMTHTKVHRIWGAIKGRCHNQNNAAYQYYGGRGIVMCERWQNSFAEFYADMGDPPSDDASIDRINNSGNYEPGNCTWSTRHQQMRNTRRNIYLTYKGETMVRKDWADKLGLTDRSMRFRLENWKNEDEIFTSPRANRWDRARLNLARDGVGNQK